MRWVLFCLYIVVVCLFSLMNEVAIVSKTKTMTVCLVFFCMCSFFLLFFLSFSFEASIQLPKLWGGGILCMYSVMYVQNNNCIHRNSPVWPSHQDLAEGWKWRFSLVCHVCSNKKLQSLTTSAQRRWWLCMTTQRSPPVRSPWRRAMFWHFSTAPIR